MFQRIKFEWVVIIALLIWIVVQKCTAPPEPINIEPYRIQIAEQDLRISQLQQDSAKLAQKIKADSLQQAQEKKAYKNTISEKSRQIANLKANPRVIEIRAQEPAIDSLINAMDSLDSIKTERIATLENNLDALRVDVGQLEANFAGLLEAEREKFKIQGEAFEKTLKENRKLRRRAKVAKVLIPVVAGLAFILGSAR